MRAPFKVVSIPEAAASLPWNVYLEMSPWDCLPRILEYLPRNENIQFFLSINNKLIYCIFIILNKIVSSKLFSMFNTLNQQCGMKYHFNSYVMETDNSKAI